MTRLSRSTCVCLVLLGVGVVASISVAWVIPIRVVWARAVNADTQQAINPDSQWMHPVPNDWPPVSGGWQCRLVGYDIVYLMGARPKGLCIQQDLLCGLPFRCVRSWSVQPDVWQVNLPVLGQTAFAMCPVWPGFALNTLFYAALAWGLWLGGWQLPLAIRRRRRRRKGLCVRCGYDRKGIGDGVVCPECGAKATRPRA